MKNISKLSLMAIPISFPPLSEQQKIAAILSSVDDVIEKTRAQIDKLKDLKTGMMQELLTKGIGSGGVPHTEFSDSPVGKIPVTWEVLEVGSFLSERRTRGLEGLPIYSVLMDGGMVLRDTVDRRVTSGLDASENRLAKQGDLAYNMMRMWQGASGIAPTNCLVSPAYVVCRPSERIHSDFLGYLLKSPAVIQLLRRYSQGLTGDRLRLYFDSFKRIKLPIPPREEQIRIADALSALDDEIDSKSMQLSLRQSLKRALMQDLLTGKVRVKLGEQESAVA
jgi:type I restriction enzyme S subunit